MITGKAFIIAEQVSDPERRLVLKCSIFDVAQMNLLVINP